MYADLIVLAVLAAFIFLRLRKSFGQDDGTEQRMRSKYERLMREQAERMKQQEKQPADEGVVVDLNPENVAEMDNVSDDVADGVAAIQKRDPHFSVVGFMQGAQAAYEMVLDAFNRGDEEVLQDLLSKEVFAEFKAVLDNAKEQNQYQHVTLVSMKEVVMTDAIMKRKNAHITVKFVTEQIRVTKDAEGKIVEGDASHVQLAEDEWVFERDVTSSNPNWTVIDN